MRIEFQCKHCKASGVITDEIRRLATWTCPTCGLTPSPRASEDLSSAIEDALTQLWWISQDLDLQITLDTGSIPTAFVPEELD